MWMSHGTSYYIWMGHYTWVSHVSTTHVNESWHILHMSELLYYIWVSHGTYKKTCARKKISQMTTTRCQRPRWWRVWPSKEIYIHANRPTQMKRDLFKKMKMKTYHKRKQHNANDPSDDEFGCQNWLAWVAVCCSVLQWVAVSGQCITVYCSEAVYCRVWLSKLTCTFENKPANMERDLFNKNYIYEKRPEKESYVQGKRPQWWRVWPSKETYIHQNRPTHTKRELYAGENICQKDLFKKNKPQMKTYARKALPEWKQHWYKRPRWWQVWPSKETCICEKKPTHMKRDLFKKNIPQMTTTRYQRPRWGRMWPSKETYIHENRPTHTKRDLFKIHINENIPRMKTTRYQRPRWWRYWLWGCND